MGINKTMLAASIVGIGLGLGIGSTTLSPAGPASSPRASVPSTSTSGPGVSGSPTASSPATTTPSPTSTAPANNTTPSTSNTTPAANTTANTTPAAASTPAATTTPAGATVIAVQQEVLVDRWRGFGTSLSWWGKGVGASSYQEAYADLFFTTKSVQVPGLPAAFDALQPLPGLGLNVASYDLGGHGYGRGTHGSAETQTPGAYWERMLGTYWVDWNDANPTSASWDWEGDWNQRSMIYAAAQRGAEPRLRMLSPPWWMKEGHNAGGGTVTSWNESQLAVYLATFLETVRKDWGVRFSSVTPFNEPSLDWLNNNYDNVDGTTYATETQGRILWLLREELRKRNLSGVLVAGSDSHRFDEAITLHKDAAVAAYTDVVTTHSYGWSGATLGQSHDNDARRELRRTVGDKRIWLTETGSNDPSGMEFAQTIIEDVNYLEAESWVLWQVLDAHGTGWGLLNYDRGQEHGDPGRGKPTWLYASYFVFAQFTRYVERDAQILASDHLGDTLVAKKGKRLVLIHQNRASVPATIAYDLSKHASSCTVVEATASAGDSSALLSPLTATASGSTVVLDVPAGGVATVVVSLP